MIIALLVLMPTGFMLLLLLLVQLGLWGSHGNLPALLAGQFESRPKHLQRDISLGGGGAHPPYTVRVTLDLAAPIAEVSDRYLSFAVDTSQVVGGKWWNPQANRVEWRSGTVRASTFDFDRPRLDLLTRALAPAYLRVGGSEADKVYYDLDTADEAQLAVPPGYESSLTRGQWDAIHAFARRNDLRVVFALNAGPGARKRDGSWDTTNAAALMAYTARNGYTVDVWELGNEVNIFFAVHGLPARVSVQQYCRDLKSARALLAQHLPRARLAVQGSAFWPVLGEPLSRFFGFMPGVLERAGDLVDLVSWHYYPQQSRRGPMASRRASPSRLLAPNNLDEVAHWAERIANWRDRYAAGKPLWLGETGNAQFGGEPGLSDAYLGGLWWLDQLGLLARLGHQVLVRQSLCGMNYGLLDEETLEPRPDYWNSLLWKLLMGSRVYAVEASGDNAGKLRVYAQATASGESGSVSVLAINLDHRRDANLLFPELTGRRFQVYQVNAPDVLGKRLLLNGNELGLDGGPVAQIQGAWREPPEGPVLRLHPLSYAFIVYPAVEVPVT
jgi:heparanase 1